jgi:uncharacterized lipoprotein YddW (UPF0748 family)
LLLAGLLATCVLTPTPTPARARALFRVSTLPPEQRPLAEAAPYRRLLWVTRWDYHSPKELESLIRLAAQARFSDVLFQVRGEGTVFYRSALEPWASELTGGDAGDVGRDPGWDPLAEAVAQAHRYGLRLHAYMNMMPGWGQRQLAPASSGQLFSTHRDWFLVTADGRRMDPRELDGSPTYAFLDPALPEARAHLAALAAEVARRYAVDGIHLDYIRYPYEHPNYSSYNPEALAAFRALAGATPNEAPEAWHRFRADQVTAVVRAVSQAARQARPGIEMSAAIIADPDDRRDGACQDVEAWLREGLLDAVAPMAYTGQMGQFQARCRQFAGPFWRDRVWLGVWAEIDDHRLLLSQARLAADYGFPGVAIFSYKDLFPANSATRHAVDLYRLFVGDGTS